jgi:hypothetical protein
VAIAILLLTWRHWLAPLLAAGLAAGTLIGFTIATTPSGLLGDHETWQGGYTWLAAVTETIAIAAGLVAFSRELWTSPIPERESVRS